MNAYCAFFGDVLYFSRNFSLLHTSAMNDSQVKPIRRANRPFPLYKLEDALVIASAIQEKNAGKPMKKLLLADAIGRKPSTIQFRDLLSSSYKYGLTVGTEKADVIELTELGQKITKPVSNEQKMTARQKAVLTPEKFSQIYTHYQNAKYPGGDFFKNALEVEFGIPREYVQEVITMLEKNGQFSGIIRDISGSPHVMLDNFGEVTGSEQTTQSITEDEEIVTKDGSEDESEKIDSASRVKATDDSKYRRVFITHGRNRAFIEPIKKLLQFGELEPIVSVERQSVSEPVPDKVMNDMRSCGAAIIHVDAEEQLVDKAANERTIINQNVLIEIGAALALYGRRFILLVKNGITLPSNLQGLYKVTYDGESLDGEVTIKLLEAINAMKTAEHPDTTTANDPK